jgi:hypothetical protein
MAIANLGIWMGVSVTPKDLIARSDFDSEKTIYTYLVLGFFLLTAAYLTKKFDLKKHFFFSYQHYGVHVTFISLLSGYFFYDYALSLVFLALFAIIAWLVYSDGYKHKSYYFVMLTVVYSYIIVSGFCLRSMFFMQDEAVLFIGFMYFILSGAAFVSILMNLNKKLKSNDHL